MALLSMTWWPEHGWFLLPMRSLRGRRSAIWRDIWKEGQGRELLRSAAKPDGRKCLLHAMVARFHLFMGRPKGKKCSSFFLLKEPDLQPSLRDLIYLSLFPALASLRAGLLSFAPSALAKPD
jgi:hypothetical protein